ncbi:hypothetical protein KI387_013316, partial [Taxus chinensis]
RPLEQLGHLGANWPKAARQSAEQRDSRDRGHEGRGKPVRAEGEENRLTAERHRQLGREDDIWDEKLTFARIWEGREGCKGRFEALRVRKPISGGSEELVPSSLGTVGPKEREGRKPAGSAETGNFSTGTFGTKGR